MILSKPKKKANMLFNSFEFFIFLPIVFVLYWFVLNKNLSIQNILLLVASYVFYGWWDVRFLSLIMLSTILDYYVGLRIHSTEEPKKRKHWLWLSMGFNLGLLCFFKYFNFFIDSWITAFNSVGIEMDPFALSIILPVGISFYTFQTMSYSLDISKRRLEPTKDFVAFATFVAFFPQLVAGPIERASNLLPQFLKRRKFDYNLAADGLRQMLWGLFKKIIIADNCAPYVNDIFANYETQSSGTLILGVIVFAFQIYADFSGYTDIAIGTARLFGFDFKRNFNFPYFSRNISEFWKKWHISLSSWLNDYLFTPLAIEFRNHKKHGIFAALFLTFLISGLWHGAGWTFIIWGGLHGLYYIPVIYSKKRFTSISTNKKTSKKEEYSLSDLPKVILTFLMVCLTYIFFRAASVADALGYLKIIFTEIPLWPSGVPYKSLFFIVIVMVTEWFQRGKEHGLQFNEDSKVPVYLRWTIYILLLLTILIFSGQQQEFIYFQF